MEQTADLQTGSGSRIKFFMGGLLILAAVIYLIATATQGNAQYFMTIDELLERREAMGGEKLRLSGAVIGESIQYDAQTTTLSFTVAHIPGDNKEIEDAGGLAFVLHQAVADPQRNRLQVVYEGVMPDLLRDEAQAIMSGELGEDGIFYASELLLKCPTKYEEAVPEQTN